MNHVLYHTRDRGSLEFLQDWRKKHNVQNQKIKLIQTFRDKVKVNSKQMDVKHDQLVSFFVTLIRRFLLKY